MATRDFLLQFGASLKRPKVKGALIFLLFLVLTFVLRLESFFQSVLDWDEGIYLLMSQLILNGEPPYTTVWDNKPPGIYLLYALGQLLFGSSIISIRIIAWIAVSISCFLLFKLGVLISGGDFRIGFVTGLLYAVFSLNSQGLAANTEIFFTPFIILAFYLLFSINGLPPKLRSRNSSMIFLIGLLTGLGFEIKYVVVFDFLAIMLIIGFESILRYKDDGANLLRRLSLSYILVITGFLLSFLLTTSYFFWIDDFDSYFSTNIVANIVNSTDTRFSLELFLQALKREVLFNSLLWLSLLTTPVYLFSHREIQHGEKKVLLELLPWFLMAFFGVSYTKLYYSHYFLQVLPPLALICAFIVVRTISYIPRKYARLKFALVGLVLVWTLASSVLLPLSRGAVYSYYRLIQAYPDWGDETQTIGNYLRKRVDLDEYIYVVDYPPTLYYLASAEIPTEFAFPLFLTDEHFSKVAGVDPINELRQIMYKKPVYVVKQYQSMTPFYRELEEYLDQDYILESSINQVELYRLQNDWK